MSAPLISWVASASASSCVTRSDMRSKVSKALVLLMLDRVSLIVRWASARFWRETNKLRLRLASSILLSRPRRAPLRFSTEVFCASHWSLSWLATSSWSALRASAARASVSSPARIASIAFFSQSAALAASCSHCFLMRFSSAMATATCFLASMSCCFMSTRT